MTQPINPTQWPKVEGTAPERGVYFVAHKTGGVCAMPYQKGETHSQDVTLYGPITFATGKNMPQVIDLSHFDLSKIEPKKQPDKPGLWHLSNRKDVLDVVQAVTTELLNHPLPWMKGEYRYLCDFIPPKQSPVIPPLPTVKLYAVEQAGVVKWCHKSKCGFWTADGLQAFGDPDAVPIAEKVVTVTE